jgi:hypothetical protein
LLQRVKEDFRWASHLLLVEYMVGKKQHNFPGQQRSTVEVAQLVKDQVENLF